MLHSAIDRLLPTNLLKHQTHLLVCLCNGYLLMVVYVCICVCVCGIQIMVANIRCAEIARDQLAAFTDDQAWQTLQQEACTAPAEDPQGGPQLVTGFNTRLTNLMDSCIQGWVMSHTHRHTQVMMPHTRLRNPTFYACEVRCLCVCVCVSCVRARVRVPYVCATYLCVHFEHLRISSCVCVCVLRYNDDALYFDASVRAEKLTELQTKLREVVAPAVQAQTRALQSQQLAVLKKELLVGLMEATVSGEGEHRALDSIPCMYRCAEVREFCAHVI